SGARVPPSAARSDVNPGRQAVVAPAPALARRGRTSPRRLVLSGAGFPRPAAPPRGADRRRWRPPGGAGAPSPKALGEQLPVFHEAGASPRWEGGPSYGTRGSRP